MEEKAPLIAEFENNGKKYIYNRDLIVVEAAELAMAVLEFKQTTNENPPKDFNQMMRSKSSDWLMIAMSFLLLEVKDGTTLAFSREKAEQTEKFIKELPFSCQAKLRECSTDFFSNTGMSSVYSQTVSGGKKKSVSEMLSAQMGAMILTNAMNSLSNGGN